MPVLLHRIKLLLRRHMSLDISNIVGCIDRGLHQQMASRIPRLHQRLGLCVYRVVQQELCRRGDRLEGCSQPQKMIMNMEGSAGGRGEVFNVQGIVRRVVAGCSHDGDID